MGFRSYAGCICMSINQVLLRAPFSFLFPSFWTLGVVALRHSISNPLDGESENF